MDTSDWAILIANSLSISDVLRKMGRSVNCHRTRRLLKKFIIDNGISTEHFKVGRVGQKTGRIPANKKNIPELLESMSQGMNPIKTAIKERLFTEGFFERKCYQCNRMEWLDKPIPLEIHHIDGDKFNHVLSNLTMLCPNCHAFTDNYRGKNNESVKVNKSRRICDCGNPKQRLSISCKDCSHKKPRKTKIEWPTLEELKSMVENSSFEAVGRSLGVSGKRVSSVIRKWARPGSNGYLVD